MLENMIDGMVIGYVDDFYDKDRTIANLIAENPKLEKLLIKKG